MKIDFMRIIVIIIMITGVFRLCYLGDKNYRFTKKIFSKDNRLIKMIVFLVLIFLATLRFWMTSTDWELQFKLEIFIFFIVGVTSYLIYALTYKKSFFNIT